MKAWVLILGVLVATEAFVPQSLVSRRRLLSSSRSVLSAAPINGDDSSEKHHGITGGGLRHQAQRGGNSIWESIKGLGRKIDQACSKAKPKAKQASILYRASTDKWQRFGYLFKLCAYYTIYMLYGGIRGIGIAMPPVYKQLYAKFGNIVEYPFEDQLITRDVNPETGNLRWRTRVNVGLLAAILSASYVIAGAVRVVWAFGGRVRETRSIVESLEAAVQKQEENEMRMKRMGNRVLPKPKNYF